MGFCFLFPVLAHGPLRLIAVNKRVVADQVNKFVLHLEANTSLAQDP